MSAGDTSVTIRPFDSWDIDAINDLLATHRPWTEYDADFDSSANGVAESGTTLVATVDGAFAGFVRWLPTGAFGQSGYLKLLGVHRDHQSAGVGTALMDAAESAVFEDAGVSDLFLLVSEFNDGARAFYARRGYVEIGPVQDYVEPGIDEVLMQKTAPDR